MLSGFELHPRWVPLLQGESKKVRVIGSSKKIAGSKEKKQNSFYCTVNILITVKCHCQRKPGRGHGSRSADSFEIPTTDYLSDMIVKYSLFNLIGDFSCEFDHPPCFWLICKRLPSQFGVTCTSYFSNLLLVFSAFLIYLDYLRFDPIVFM